MRGGNGESVGENNAVLVAKGMMAPIGVGLYELEGRNSSQVEEGNLPSAPTLLQVNIVDHTVVSVHAGAFPLPGCDETLDPMAGLREKLQLLKALDCRRLSTTRLGSLVASAERGGEGEGYGAVELGLKEEEAILYDGSGWLVMKEDLLAKKRRKQVRGGGREKGDRKRRED